MNDLMNGFHSKWISNCGRYTVYIGVTCYKKMIKKAVQSYPNEIGSSLIGFYSTHGFDSYICDITPIPKDSKSSLISFTRGIWGLDKFYKKLLSKHKNSKYYIGEWHTHPNGSPFPSQVDDVNQLKIAHDPKTFCTECILVILAGKLSHAPHLGVFVYSRNNGRVVLNQIV